MAIEVTPGVVAAGIGGRFGVPEPLELDPTRKALLHELPNAGLVHPGNQELYGAADERLALRASGKAHAGRAAQDRFDGPVARIPFFDEPVQIGKLRAEDRRPEVVHAPRAVRGVEADAVEHVAGRNRAMPAVQHVGPGQYRRARHQLLVVGGDESTLAGVDVLVGLRAEAGRDPVGAALRLPPPRPHRVRAVLDDRDAERVGGLHEGVHVGDVSAHVREHQHPRLAGLRLAREVVEVDDEVLGDLHQHRLAPRRRDGPRYRRQREAVGQHGLAGREAEGAQRGLQRIAPRRAGETETCAHVRRELVLQKDGLRHLAVDDVVPMQPSRAHDGDGTLDALLGYRRLLREVSVESARHRVLHRSRDRGAGAS